ncbi:MAG: CDP-glycerol glycerophosphotransferase family protein [Coprococcus sp.]|jgi:possible TPR repeat-containing protein
MGEIIKKIKRKKWELMFYLRNSIYYAVKRKRKSLPPINKNNIKVCFIVQRTEIFTSVQSVFETMCSDNRFSVSILVLPRYDHAKKKVDISTIEKNIDFCKNLDEKITVINPYNTQTKSFEGISGYNFDFIFLGLPYAGEYPEEYHFKTLSQYSRLCYVPYGSSYTDGMKMIKGCFTDNLLSYVDYLFADCDKVYNYCNSKLRLCKNTDLKSIVYNLGYPRFDLIKRSDKSGNAKTFLWLPRWTTNFDNNEKSTFLENKDVLIDYFKEHSELILIIRPHPLMFSHYIAMGIMSQTEVNDYKSLIASLPNVSLDESSSYMESFEKADCLIADYSAIDIEFLLTGRPIIYLDNVNAMDKNISDALYVSDRPKMTVNYINKLIVGDDEKEELRNKALKLKVFRKGVARDIVESLLN